MPRQSDAAFVGERSFSKSWGLRASGSFTPLPLPLHSFFCSRSSFFDELARNRLLRRLPLFIRPHLTILLIGNRLVLREVLWFASPGTGGVALRLSPSAHTCTTAPPVLVCIVQQLVQLRGLSIPGRMEKGVLRPLQLQVPPWEATLAALRVFSLFR